MSMTVWEWFEQRSFHHRDFHSLALSGNGAERPTTTLVLPGRNVAGTSGTILDVVAGLRQRTDCLIRSIVVDADSPDGTADIARAHGRRGLLREPAHARLRARPGQGRRHVAGPVDRPGRHSSCSPTPTRLTFASTFVYGTLGPLLTDPAIQFLQGGLPAAVHLSEKSVADGGWRVTELMAKAADQPLLSAASRVRAATGRGVRRSPRVAERAALLQPATASRSA